MTREEAIRWLEDIHRRFNPTGENLENEGGDVHLQALDMAIEALSAEQKTGEWISNHDGSWNCSECGLRVFIYAKGNFCPNCGARMLNGGEQDGNV